MSLVGPDGTCRVIGCPNDRADPGSDYCEDHSDLEEDDG